VAADLKQLRQAIKIGALDPHLLEEHLRRYDEDLLSAVGASLRPEEMSALEDAAERALGGSAGRMTGEALDRTRRAHLARLLRKTAGLPRLTLFDD
jgi:hypothetical protein